MRQECYWPLPKLQYFRTIDSSVDLCHPGEERQNQKKDLYLFRIMKDLFESHLCEIIPFISELKIPSAEFYLPNILPRIKSSI